MWLLYFKYFFFFLKLFLKSARLWKQSLKKIFLVRLEKLMNDLNNSLSRVCKRWLLKYISHKCCAVFSGRCWAALSRETVNVKISWYIATGRARIVLSAPARLCRNYINICVKVRTKLYKKLVCTSRTVALN